MRNHLLNFERMPWTEAGKGVRYKAYKYENQQVRLVEFSEGFIEEDWCTHGHVAYVLDGSFATDYSGVLEYYKSGDIVYIPQGETDKHKAVLGKGERVLLLLFEII